MLGDDVPVRPAVLLPDTRRQLPFPAANSPPWQIEGVVRALSSAQPRRVVCLQSRPSWSSRLVGEDLNGYQPLLDAYRIAPLSAGAMQRFERETDASVVLLPSLKTDWRLGLGGALVCALPLLAGQSGPAAERLVDLLAAWRAAGVAVGAAMDATSVGYGPGPYRLTPHVRDVLLASTDPIALDTLAAWLMGLDPLRDVPYLRLAHARGLGVADLSAIELVGDRQLAQAPWRVGSAYRPRVWPAAGTRLETLLRRGQPAYHNLVRWPLSERWLFEGWLRGTSWGRLFGRYQRLGRAPL